MLMWVSACWSRTSLALAFPMQCMLPTTIVLRDWASELCLIASATFAILSALSFQPTTSVQPLENWMKEVLKGAERPTHGQQTQKISHHWGLLIILVREFSLGLSLKRFRLHFSFVFKGKQRNLVLNIEIEEFTIIKIKQLSWENQIIKDKINLNYEFS